MKYGTPPQIIGTYKLPVNEMMFYMYLPICMPLGSQSEWNVPKRLLVFLPLINAVRKNLSVDYLTGKYVYITAKHLFVTPENMGNRPGWHSDGFGTEDLNYIWMDKYPTEFCVQDFDLSTDCDISMQQMHEHAKPENIKTYGENVLLKLDQYQIHRVPITKEAGMRTFVKISVSKEQYNLKGNSHNYLFHYNWKMHDRAEARNHPVCKETDFLK